MDAFFASVEQRDNPRLKNKPIAITGSSSRTVLVSPSYEARAFGVKTGMTKPQAQKLCPGIIFVTGNTSKYTDACSQIVKILYRYTPDIEVFSIDEFFLDITNTMHLFGAPLEMALAMQKDVRDKIGLSCSVGIACNKLLAKFASDRKKPGGIFEIKPGKENDVLENAAVDELCGIGKSLKEALSGMGIFTVGDLRRHGPAALKKAFGINGLKLHLMASGKDSSPVIPIGDEGEARSMGHSMTFKSDTSDPQALSRYLLELSDMVGRRLRKAGLSAQCIKLTVRYKSFQTFTKQKTLESATDDTKQIYTNAQSILRSIRLKEPVRLLGISAARFSNDPTCGSLFEESKRKYRINRVLDSINERFGDAAVSFASLIVPSGHSKVISPAWRPYGERNY